MARRIRASLYLGELGTGSRAEWRQCADTLCLVARAECSAKYNRGVQEIFEEASPALLLLCPACWATKLTRRGLDVNGVVSCRLRGSRSMRRGAVRLAGAVERRTATRTSATVCSCERGFSRRVVAAARRLQVSWLSFPLTGLT